MTKERIRSLDIELLAAELRAYDISREFTHAIMVDVYLPPLLSQCCDAALWLISRDFITGVD